MVLENLDRYMKKNETRPPTYTTNQKNSKCIKDSNVTCETIKIIEENIDSKSQASFVAIFLPIYLCGQRKYRKK